jgi:hypothetical protein
MMPPFERSNHTSKRQTMFQQAKRAFVFVALLTGLGWWSARYSHAQDQAAMPSRPLILGVAHIAFQVSDLAKARAFYGELLGYDEPFQIRREDNALALTYYRHFSRGIKMITTLRAVDEFLISLGWLKGRPLL